MEFVKYYNRAVQDIEDDGIEWLLDVASNDESQVVCCGGFSFVLEVGTATCMRGGYATETIPRADFRRLIEGTLGARGCRAGHAW